MVTAASAALVPGLIRVSSRLAGVAPPVTRTRTPSASPTHMPSVLVLPPSAATAVASALPLSGALSVGSRSVHCDHSPPERVSICTCASATSDPSSHDALSIENGWVSSLKSAPAGISSFCTEGAIACGVGGGELTTADNAPTSPPPPGLPSGATASTGTATPTRTPDTRRRTNPNPLRVKTPPATHKSAATTPTSGSWRPERDTLCLTTRPFRRRLAQSDAKISW